MPENTRKASPPSIGAARDAVRTLIGFGVFMLVAKVVGDETAVSLSEPVQAMVVMVTSALFAFVGKKLRNSGSVAGEVV